LGFIGLVYLYGLNRQMRGLITLLFLLPLAVACLENPDCVNKKNDLVGVTFKSMNTGADTTLTIDSIAADGSIVNFVAPGAVSKIFLPLDYLNDTTFYILEINDTIYNLTLSYRAQPQYVSEECGERFLLNNLQVANHSFDSVSVTNHQPGVEANTSNIQIFR